MKTATTKTFEWLFQALEDLAPGARVSATGVPWAVYDRLVHVRDHHSVRTGVRIAFDRGRIELMSPSFRHERPALRLCLIVVVLAEELGLPLINARSTTLRRESAEHGLEPDECFYIAHAPDMLEVEDIDLTIHPPPDVAIEVDVSHSTLPKEAIYGPMRIPELWRHDKGRVTIRVLGTGRKYKTAARSAALPLVTADDLSRLLRDHNKVDDMAFVRACRAWAKTLVPPAAP